MTSDTAVLPTPPAIVPRPRGRLAQLGADSAYNFLRFPIAIAAFVTVVTGLSLGAGLLVIWVGVAVFAVSLVVMRGFAMLERNPSTGPGAKASARLPQGLDEIPQREMDALLWKSIHGWDSKPPQPGPNAVAGAVDADG